MYRNYEDPNAVQSAYDKAKAELEIAIDNGADSDEIISLHEKMLDLKEQLSFAWSDDEYNACFQSV